MHIHVSSRDLVVTVQEDLIIGELNAVCGALHACTLTNIYVLFGIVKYGLLCTACKAYATAIHDYLHLEFYELEVGTPVL